MCPRAVGLLLQPGDSLWIPVTTRAAGGHPRVLAAQPRAGHSLPSPACSNFSPMLLWRSYVGPAYSLWTAASRVLPVTRGRCPSLGPTHSSQSTHPQGQRPPHPQILEPQAGDGCVPGGPDKAE